MAILLQEGGGQYVIEQQREHGRGDDGARRREPDAFGRGRRLIALVDGDEAQYGAEYQTLDDALDHIAQADGPLHLRPEGASIDAHQLHADELRAIEPDDVENG